MILADTSIWVDHQRSPFAPLNELLSRSIIVMHPWVIGELACGSLPNRETFLLRLTGMIQLRVATEDQVLRFLKMHTLHAKGIGYVDMQLLASTALNGVRLWSRDKRLSDTAAKLNLAYQP